MFLMANMPAFQAGYAGSTPAGCLCTKVTGCPLSLGMGRCRVRIPVGAYLGDAGETSSLPRRIDATRAPNFLNMGIRRSTGAVSD